MARSSSRPRWARLVVAVIAALAVLVVAGLLLLDRVLLGRAQAAAADLSRSWGRPVEMGGLAIRLVPRLGAADPAPPRASFKILHVKGYHSPWRWTDGQLEGFREGLGDVPVELRVFQMDTKRNSSPAAIERAGREARALVDEWKPDLLYTTDDDAQAYVARHYVNRDMPVVFSGVNEDPAVYGFVGSRNVTGVVEQQEGRKRGPLLVVKDRVHRKAVADPMHPRTPMDGCQSLQNSFSRSMNGLNGLCEGD